MEILSLPQAGNFLESLQSDDTLSIAPRPLFDLDLRLGLIARGDCPREFFSLGRGFDFFR